MRSKFNLSDLPRWQRPLLAGAWLCIALLLLAPLVVTVETAYPFAVGKAVYARTLVAISVVLWVPLALANGRFRPPRSWLPVLLGVSFAVGLLAAAAGIDFERSLWSTYSRLHGIVDSAHWLALVLVLVSVVHGAGQWRTLLTLNLAVSSLVALLAIGRFHGLDLPYLGDVPEVGWRVSASLGNTAFLGHYALLNGIVACGLAAGSLSASPRFGKGTFRREPAKARGQGNTGQASLWRGVNEAGGMMSVVWPSVFLLAAACNFWAMALSGTLAAYAAFVPATGALALAYAFGEGKVGRRFGVGGLVVVGMIGAGLAFLFFVDNPLKSRAQDLPLVKRLALASIEGSSTQTRLAAWRAGMEGISERPLLGWGPENFIVPYGKFGAGAATRTYAHDRAHNEFVEEAVAKGLPGVVAYVAIWALTFVVVVRYVRSRQGPRAPPESAPGTSLAMYIGAALVADLLLKQTLFAHTTGMLQYTLLIGFVIGLESELRGEGTGPRVPGAVVKGVRWLGAPWSRGLVITLTMGLATAAAYSSIAAYAGAKALVQLAAPLATLADLDRAISAFPPLANAARRLFLDDLANNWNRLRLHRSAEAARLLARADVEAAAAERAEPHNWLIIHSIARLYREVAATDPEYEQKAERYVRRALELAPNMEISPARN